MSQNEEKYNNFDWELYLTNYPDLKSNYYTKDKTWWHFINIGENNDYIYFDIRKCDEYYTGFNNFDWELYLTNYPDLKSHYDNKDKTWWHFINIGKKNDYIYFDIRKRNEYYSEYKNFDWELYLTNYPDLKCHYDNKDKTWWHFINIGKKNDYIYFDIHKRDEYYRNYNNFDWELYLTNYPDLKSHYDNKDKTWWHFINIGEKNDYIYFDVKFKFNQLFKNENLFYYVGTTAYQDFNTGIQRVTRNLSKIIGHCFKDYNLFLVIYDEQNNDLRLLNDNELSMFCKYNGYNHNEKIELFEKVKGKGERITFFIPELFHINQYDILNKVIEISKNNKYRTVHIYHDDTIYNNSELPGFFRKDMFDTYIKIISKMDVILPNSNYSKSTYLFHKKRLAIDTFQIIKAVPLSGELLNIKRVTKKETFGNYIFSNISITKRKNVEKLIQAFNLLNNDFLDLQLIICGVVYEESKYYTSFKTKLTKNILFVQDKTDEEISELYKNALFSVYPSIEEGFGLPIYESLWNCTPVICHNATSTHEIASEVNSESVASIDCLNTYSLYLQMKKWMDNEYLKKICGEIKSIRIKTWHQYTNEIICSIKKEVLNKKITLYYYVHHTATSNFRTGIQNYTICLAKQFVKKKLQVIFVKWDETINALVPCNDLEIDHMFNYNETDDTMDKICYGNNKAIHLTNKEIKKSIFFNPEYTSQKYAANINSYLLKNSIKSVHILHDIIPLVLDNYSSGRESFNTYFINNILTSNKIITVSIFSKTEFYDYLQKNISYSRKNVPTVTSILLPYQYRSKERYINSEFKKNKLSILLPGSIEDRKQQLVFIKLFNKFITLNPKIDIELITFGHIYNNKDEVLEEIKKSNNKIKYLGIINNNILFDLYRSATFSCYISYYEGFGLPISESLWHGTPVLTSNFGSMYEVAHKGGCYCVDTKDENEIYEALEKLVKNPEILVKLRKEIEKADLTTWESYADDVYNEILSV